MNAAFEDVLYKKKCYLVVETRRDREETLSYLLIPRMRSRPGLLFLAGIVPAFVAPRAPPSFLEPIEGGLGPGRGEWPSGQKRQTKRVASGLAFSRSPLAYVVVGLPTRTRPPECLLGSGRSQADTYDRRRKDPHLIAPGERKFDRGLERRGGRKGSGWI
ncbi:hypothetical protein V6N11_014019 [Hibiscus sabdariffa]|uniref:Uncharacterized protein n=1 Tax=Hibiscus sabdariffa TaxID=183260 RepID=A0ABR2AFK6_9ROSI